MADVEILAQQVAAAPLNYTIPGGQEIVLKCLAASFDGAAAAAPWQPAIQVVGPSGQVLRTFPLATPVAAGASADVTWFPRGGVSAGGGGGGGGLQFNSGTYGPENVGDFLHVKTTGQDGDGNGALIADTGDGGWTFTGTGLGANGPSFYFQTTTTGSSESGTIGGEATSVNGAALFINGGAAATGTGSATGLTTGAAAHNGLVATGVEGEGTTTGSAAAYGVRGIANGGAGSGDATAGHFHVLPGPGTTHAYVLRGQVTPNGGTLKDVLIVDPVGNIHIPVGASVINDL